MVRSYAPTPVDPAIVDRALENATHAPSAGFSQGWGFLVLDDPDDVRRFWATSTDVNKPSQWLSGMMRAPVVILPCSSKAAYLDRYAQRDKGWTDRDEARWPMPFWHLDAAMAALLILQTVTDAGLGGCFFGIVPGREGELREAFGIGERFDPIGAITIGHPATGPATRPTGSPTTRARTPWTEVVHRGSWRHPDSPPA